MYAKHHILRSIMNETFLNSIEYQNSNFKSNESNESKERGQITIIYHVTIYQWLKQYNHFMDLIHTNEFKLEKWQTKAVNLNVSVRKIWNNLYFH